MNSSKKMDKNYKIQVPTETYFSSKMLRENIFLALYTQINAVVSTNPKSVLEIGIGNGNLSEMLKRFGYEVTTCDFDKTLKPDFVADIRKLPFKDNQFDAVIANEILEHLPFGDVPKALEELRRVSKKNIILSVPNSCISFGILFKFKIPFFAGFKNISFHFPYDWINPKLWKFNGEHYWEMGRKGYSKKKIFKLFKKYFIIKKHFTELIQPEHYFFILEKPKIKTFR